MTEADKAEVWRRYGEGASAAMIAKAMGFHATSVAELIRKAGGIRPKPRCPSPGRLSIEDREQISRGLAAGGSIRCIARRLERAPPTSSRAIARSGRPPSLSGATRGAGGQAPRPAPKPAKLAADPLLGLIIADKLAKNWSPEEICWGPSDGAALSSNGHRTNGLRPGVCGG